MLTPSYCGQTLRQRWLRAPSPLPSVIPAFAGMTVIFLGEFAPTPIRSL